MYQMFPLLSISFIIYAALAVIGVPGVDLAGKEVLWHQGVLVEFPLYSKEKWAATGGDLFLLLSFGLLFVELVRSTKTGSDSIANHLLSFMLFIVVLLCFILAPGFGNSTFFLFMIMTLLDPMVGMVVTTVTARRDLAVGEDGKRALLG
jgi:hypothetical protein